MKKGTIDVSANIKKRLREEFGTSKASVQSSLDYYYNSDMSKAIRQRAKEMLEEEVEKIEKETKKD